MVHFGIIRRPGRVPSHDDRAAVLHFRNTSYPMTTEA